MSYKIATTKGVCVISEKVKVAFGVVLSTIVVVGVTVGIISLSPKKVEVTETEVEVEAVAKQEETPALLTVKVSNITADPSQIILLNTEVTYDSIRLAISRLEEARLQGQKRMFLVIDSPGGSVIDGAELITYITSSSMKIDTYCRGICASMAAQIHQVGHTRYISEKGILMFHPASGGAQGTLEQMKSRIDMLKKYVDRMDMQIAKRSGIPYEKFKAMLVSELWLEGVDALNLNLADKIATLRFSESSREATEIFDLKKEMEKLRGTTPFPPSSQSVRDFK